MEVNITYKYKVFLSYNHNEADKRWARWLAKKLEAYKIPARLLKAGDKKKLGKIYRDEDESIAAGDLSEHIKDALINSEFLIVICSKNTLTSKWVRDEILYFRSLGREEKILTLLVDGEPEESIPEELLKDSKGNEIMPLAADIRRLVDERFFRTKNKAFARLTAPIIGCSFDDLWRREAQRKNRTLAAVGVTVFGVLSVFAGVLAWQQTENASEARIATIQALQASSELLSRTAEDKGSFLRSLIVLESNNHDPMYMGDRLTAAKQLNGMLKNIHFHHQVEFDPVRRVTVSDNNEFSILTRTYLLEPKALIKNFEMGKIELLEGTISADLEKFSADSRFVLIFKADKLSVYSTFGATPLYDIEYSEFKVPSNTYREEIFRKVGFHANGHQIVYLGETIVIIDLLSGRVIANIPAGSVEVKAEPMYLGADEVIYSFALEGKTYRWIGISENKDEFSGVHESLHGTLFAEVDGTNVNVVEKANAEIIQTLYGPKINSTAVDYSLVDDISFLSSLSGFLVEYLDDSIRYWQRGSQEFVDIGEILNLKEYPQHPKYHGVVHFDDELISTFHDLGKGTNYHLITAPPGMRSILLDGHLGLSYSKFGLSKKGKFFFLKSIDPGWNESKIDVWNLKSLDPMISYSIEDPANQMFYVSNIFSTDEKYAVLNDGLSTSVWRLDPFLKIGEIDIAPIAIGKDHLLAGNLEMFRLSDLKSIRKFTSDTWSVKSDFSSDESLFYSISHKKENTYELNIFDTTNSQPIFSKALDVSDFHSLKVKFVYPTEFVLLIYDDQFKVIHIESGDTKYSNLINSNEYPIIDSASGNLLFVTDDSVKKIELASGKIDREWPIPLLGKVVGVDISNGSVVFKRSTSETIIHESWNINLNKSTGLFESKNQEKFLRFHQHPEGVFLGVYNGSPVYGEISPNGTIALTQKTYTDLLLNDEKRGDQKIFAAAAKVMSRCLSPQERIEFDLQPDPPCWCQEKSQPTIESWAWDYLERNLDIKSKYSPINPNELTESRLEADDVPNPFTRPRSDGWTCPPAGEGYSAPWNEFEDLRNLTPAEILGPADVAIAKLEELRKNGELK